MLIDLNILNVEDQIVIEEKVLKDANLDKRINDLENAWVKGKIYENSAGEIILDVNFSGIMDINDAITLESIPYEFAINIQENLEEIKENYLDCYENDKNILDLKQILWQNIVLEVPISYTALKEDEKTLKGNGWELLNEEKKSAEIDPRLKKLEELLER